MSLDQRKLNEFVGKFESAHNNTRRKTQPYTKRWQQREPSLLILCRRTWNMHSGPGAGIKIQEVVRNGGFTRFRRATQTPFNRVFEARP